MTSGEQGKGRRLDSWKAIANYLGHEVRSVQRWERERGLPVYRLPGQKSGVFAYEEELKSWRFSRSEPAAAEGPVTTATEDRAGAPRRLHVILPALVVTAIAAITIGMILRTGAPKPASPPRPQLLSLAVLPMQNLSGDAGQDYFADGFTDELTTELAGLRSLRVISRTSTMLYKHSAKPLPQIARELKVKYILEGSVTRDGDRVRVTAQLIDAATDSHVFARSYDGDVRDVLDIQSRIARAVAADVNLDLSSGERMRLAAAAPVDPEAHDLYLKASYAFAQQTPDSIHQSLALYQAAVRRAPNFARAWLGIALTEAALVQITAENPRNALLHEEAALKQALSIDPRLGDAHGLLASIAYWYDWDWPRSEREFRSALADGAQAPTEQRFGAALVMRGRYQEGLAHLETALELDPFGKSPRVNWVMALHQLRRYADERRELDALLKSTPGFLAGHVLKGNLDYAVRDCGDADAQAQWLRSHFPSALSDTLAASAHACRGDIAAARHDLETAATENNATFVSPYGLAIQYAAIHDRDHVLSNLERSADIPEPQVLYIKVEHLFDWLRGDPRFIALEKRLHLAG